MKKTSTLLSLKGLFMIVMVCFASVSMAQTTILKETFDEQTGTGGNDDKWSGSIASAKIVGLTDWSPENGSGASKCVKLGSSSKLGKITTPALSTLSGNAILTFRAGAWAGDQTDLKLSISGGGTLDQASVTMKSGEFTSFTVNITGGTAESKITFEGKQASKARFFLDDVEVVSVSGDITLLSAPSFSSFDLGYGNNDTNPFVEKKGIKITHTNEAGTVYYTVDGTEPTATSTLYDFDNNGPVVLNQTCTLKAIVIDGENSSSVTSKEYTAISAANIFTNFADLRAKGVSTTDYIAVTPNEAFYIFGALGNHYISDGENTMLVYGNDIFPENVLPGATLNGALIGNYIEYYGMTEISNVQVLRNFTEDESADPIAINPVEVKANDFISDYAAHEHKLVTVKGVVATADTQFETAKATNANFKDGETDFVVRNHFKTIALEIKAGTTYNVTGFVAQNESKDGVVSYQIFPRSAEDVVESTGTAINATEAAQLTIGATKGAVVINAVTETTINIYTIAGQLVNKTNVNAGITTISLPAGVYIVEGVKVVIL